MHKLVLAIPNFLIKSKNKLEVTRLLLLPGNSDLKPITKSLEVSILASTLSLTLSDLYCKKKNDVICF